MGSRSGAFQNVFLFCEGLEETVRPMSDLNTLVRFGGFAQSVCRGMVLAQFFHRRLAHLRFRMAQLFDAFGEICRLLILLFGTGRWDGASGGGILTGAVNPDGTFSYETRGSISQPGKAKGEKAK